MVYPTVNVGDWIKVGSSNMDAYVFCVRSEVEVAAGYYQNRLKAIKDDFVWNGQTWQFKDDTPNGSYLRGSDASLVKRGPYSRN